MPQSRTSASDWLSSIPTPVVGNHDVPSTSVGTTSSRDSGATTLPVGSSSHSRAAAIRRLSDLPRLGTFLRSQSCTFRARSRRRDSLGPPVDAATELAALRKEGTTFVLGHAGPSTERNEAHAKRWIGRGKTHASFLREESHDEPDAVLLDAALLVFRLETTDS